MARHISDIAWEITRSWKKVNYAAAPYLQAMFSLVDIKDQYGAESAHGVLTYFLSNAKAFRGPDARRLKAELKELMTNG